MLIYFLSIRFSFSNGLLCVTDFGILMKSNIAWQLRDNVKQSENKISKKKQPWAQCKNSSFFSFTVMQCIYQYV